MTKQIAIVGKAASSKYLAPYQSEDWQIWSISDNHMDIPRWDEWFEIHDCDFHEQNSPHHWKWLTDPAARGDRPLWLLKEDSRFPGSKRFPREKVIGLFDGLFNDGEEFRYWTNSIAWIVGYAITHNPSKIGIWGVDMAQATEYECQRPSCEAVLGFAMGRGIKVIVPQESDVFKCHRLYGYETHNGTEYVQLRTRKQELRERIDVARKELEQVSQQFAERNGQLQQLRAIASLNGNGQTPEEYFQKRVGELESEIKQLANYRDSTYERQLILQGALENISWTESVFLT